MKFNQKRRHLLCSAKLGVLKTVVRTVDLKHGLVVARNKKVLVCSLLPGQTGIKIRLWRFVMKV